MSEPGAPQLDLTEIVPTAPQLPVPGEGPSTHVRLFGTHMFFRLWLAQVVSALGDWLGFLAVIILASRIGAGSEAASVGFVMIARILPAFFLAPVAGVLVDRLDRKKVMVACDLGRAAVVATLPFVDTVLGLVVASLILEIGTLMWSPAKEASVPNLVPPEYLTTANSLSLAAAYGTFPIASAIFAVLATAADWLGGFHALDVLRVNEEASLAFYVDVATFLASAAMISTLALPKRPARDRTAGGRVDWAQTFHELKEGWHFIFINPVVRAVNVGLATGLIGGGMLVPLGVVFSQEVLGAGAAGYGLFITALGFGVAVGVLGVSVLQRRLPKAQTFTCSLFVAAVALFLAASQSSLTPAALLVAVIGVCAGSVYVLGFTLLHENVEDAFRGRIFSALYSLVRLCLLLAFAVGPFLSELLGRLSSRHLDSHIKLFGFDVFVPGVRITLWLAAFIILAAGVLALMSVRAASLTAVAAAADDPTE
jgi:dTMP kinase